MVAATIVGVGAIVQAAFEEAAEERELISFGRRP